VTLLVHVLKQEKDEKEKKKKRITRIRKMLLYQRNINIHGDVYIYICI